VGGLQLRFLFLLRFFVPKQGKTFFTLSDSPVAMASVLSSVGKSNPAIGSPRRLAYLDLTRTEHREFVDLSYPSSKVSTSKAHWGDAVENDSLSDTEIDTDHEDLPTLEQMAANATKNRNAANQTHEIQDAETTSGDEQMNDRIMHTQEILLGSIQGDHMCSKTNFLLELINYYSHIQRKLPWIYQG
jgi:hypothetical protein